MITRVPISINITKIKHSTTKYESYPVPLYGIVILPCEMTFGLTAWEERVRNPNSPQRLIYYDFRGTVYSVKSLNIGVKHSCNKYFFF